MAIEKIDKKIKMWMGRISATEKFIKDSYEQNWKKWVGMYNSIQWGKGTSKSKTIVVNYAYAIARTKLASLYIKDPRITVTPSKKIGENRDRAFVIEQGLNHWWRENRLKIRVKSNILTTILIGLDWMKLTLEKGRVKPSRVSPLNIRWPMDYVNYYWESPWLVERVITTKEKLRENPNYDKGVIKRMKPSFTIKATDTLEKTSDFQKFVTYQVWDREHEKFAVLADGIFDKPLRAFDKSDYFKVDGFIYEMMSFDEIPDQFVPMSGYAPVEGVLNEINKSRTQLMSHRRRMKGVYLYDEELYKQEDIEKIINSDDQSIIGVKGLKEGSIQVLDQATLPAEVYNITNIAKADLNEIIGQSEYRRAGTQPGVETATEALMIERGQKLRPDEQLDCVEDYCKDIARKVRQLWQIGLKGRKDVTYFDDMGVLAETNFTKEEIQGEYQESIEIGSTLPMSIEVRRKQAQDTIQILADPRIDQLLDRENKEIRISEPLKGLLRDMGNVDIEKTIVDRMPEMNPQDIIARIQAIKSKLGMKPQDLQKGTPNSTELRRQVISKPYGNMAGKVPTKIR